MDADIYKDFEELKSNSYFTFTKCKKGDDVVVLKGLKAEYQKKKSFQQALKKEFQMGQKMNHVGILKYLDFIEDEKYGNCVVLEYVEGRRLRDYLKENHSDDEKLSIVNQIGGALSYIHSQGIVFGGLNPDNVLVTTNGNSVKLFNFRTLDSYDLDTFEITKYLAPEQKDSTLRCDGSADIFALGVIMKDMGLFAGYEEVIKKCICLGKQDRFADASEFLDALNDDSTPININKKWVFTGVAAVVIFLVVFVVFKGGYLNDIPSMALSSDSTNNENDTVNSKQIIPAAEQPAKDTSSVDKNMPEDAATTGNPLETEIKQGLDSVFAPYVAKKDEGLNSSEWRGLHRQQKEFYRKVTRAHSDLTEEDKQMLDETFAGYVKEKTREITGKKDEQ